MSSFSWRQQQGPGTPFPWKHQLGGSIGSRLSAHRCLLCESMCNLEMRPKSGGISCQCQNEHHRIGLPKDA